MAQRTWTADELRALLDTNTVFLERSIRKVAEYQTSAEYSAEQTNQDNGVGFNGVDAPFLTSLAKQVATNKWNKPEGSILSAKQVTVARKMMRKYANQLAKIANGKIARPSA